MGCRPALADAASTAVSVTAVSWPSCPAAGPLVMVQAVFADGALVACHANLRVHEGAGGGASHKRSVLLPAAREHLGALGRQLRDYWLHRT